MMFVRKNFGSVSLAASTQQQAPRRFGIEGSSGYRCCRDFLAALFRHRVRSAWAFAVT